MANISSTTFRAKLEPDFHMHERAMRSIAQGYLTNSKRPESLIKGVYPTHLKRGIGCYAYDYADRKYIDFITGLGVNLFGYANESIYSAAVAALAAGQLLSLSSEQEILTAEKLKELFTFVDCWKFLKTGSDACSAAVRIARAKTGRKWVMSDGYHGWHDGFVSLTDPAVGVTGDHFYKKLDITKIDKTVAAVIIEPVITDISQPRIIELKAIREACKEMGALLIFDEIITGFRVPKFSIAGHLGIDPDLICLGKAMANGFALSAVGGKYNTMNCAPYFVSSTYASSTEALAACWKVADMLQRKEFDIDQVWTRGASFLAEFNAIWPEGLMIKGYPTRGVFVGNEMVRAQFFQECCYAGILVGPSFWINFPLLEVLDNSLKVFKEILRKIKLGNVKLVGEMPQNPFAQKIRHGN